MLKHHHSNALNLHYLFLEKLTSKQRLKVKSSIIDTNSCLNRILPLFNPLHKKLTPGFWLVDIFSNHFSFNIAECKINDYKAAHLWKLDNIFKDSLYDTKIVIIISNASIKNNIAMSIAHVHSGENIVAKTIYYAVNVILTEAELFVIKYGINQIIQVNYISCIIIVTDAIHSVRHIFDLLSYSYQIQSIITVQDLRSFFKKSVYNSIEFCDCFSNTKLLQLMPPGDNMDMGKGYDDNDWLHWSSLSQRLI